MANKNQFVEGELINTMQTWDKNKKTPIGIEPMTSLPGAVSTVLRELIKSMDISFSTQ